MKNKKKVYFREEDGTPLTIVDMSLTKTKEPILMFGWSDGDIDGISMENLVELMWKAQQFDKMIEIYNDWKKGV